MLWKTRLLLLILSLLLFQCLNIVSASDSKDLYFTRGVTADLPLIELVDPGILEADLAVKVSNHGSFGLLKQFPRLPIFQDMLYSHAFGVIDYKSPDALIFQGKFLDIKFDSVSKQLVYLPSASNLTMKAQQALDIVPTWLKDSLRDTFLRMNNVYQDQYADLIIGAPDPRYIDEIAFAVANLPINWTTGPWFQTGLITENAEQIYAMDLDLDYVEIIDYGTPGIDPDYYTTARYKVLKSGVPSTYELSRDLYYWMVTFPKLTDERPRYIDPTTGSAADPPIGQYWRTYLFNDNPDRSYMLHWIMKTPGTITGSELQGWGPSSYGYLKDFSDAPLEILRESGTGKPCMVEFCIGTGRVVATVMPVETAYENGESNLLFNMIDYGNGDFRLPAGSKIAIFKDSDPWGKPTVESALTSLGWSYDVYTSADMATVDLSPYKKVIIPSGQPYTFYQALELNSSIFETFTNDGKVFQFHGATLPADDWTGLVMPGGFTCAPQAANSSDTIIVWGHWLLKEVMQGTQYYWDETVGSYPGSRDIQPGDTALNRIGNFIGKNMFDNVSEHAAKYGYGGTERSIQPVRIVYNHYGNCGELQDMAVSSLRTCLIPAWGTGTHTNDHVWGEFFYEESPYYFDIYWSNSSTRIAIDKGGRTNDALMLSYRGDGMVYNSIERYRSDAPVTVNFTITDTDGLPVDGARIILYMYSSPYMFPGLAVYTDKQGKASATMGTNYDFYVKVFSGLGTYPTSNPVKIINAADCTPGSVFNWSYSFSTPINTPRASLKPYFIGPMDPVYKFQVDMNASFMTLYGDGMVDGAQFHDFFYPGELDVYVVDQANYDKFKNGLDFEAAVIEENISTTNFEFTLPHMANWHVIVSNKDSVICSQQLAMTESLVQESSSAVPELQYEAFFLLGVLITALMVIHGYRRMV